jgi:hypothetical protein
MENRYGVRNPNKGVVKSLHESPQFHRVYPHQTGAIKSQERVFLMNAVDLAKERELTVPGGGNLSKSLFTFGES